MISILHLSEHEILDPSEHEVKDIFRYEKILSILFKQQEYSKCIEVTEENGLKKLKSNYYVGVDWLCENQLAVYVKPKIDNESRQTDYLRMLFSCLRHSDILSHTNDLYEVKLDKPYVEISQKQDLLTPLLVIHFLQILKIIVKKGLKKSHLERENNLDATVKGKILITKTIKKNIIKNKQTKIFCRYQEFGLNSIENRILKLTLLFVQRYLALFPDFSKLASPVLNYCLPAFQEVNENVELVDIKKVTHNPFYKEYKDALRVSLIILKRFGYNMKEINKNDKVKVPPFWIDMSKLFELYVLGLLKDTFFNNVRYQIKGNYGQPDFILTDAEKNIKMIIDTKYKKEYDQSYIIDDIRQLSGYARDIRILKELGYKEVFENKADVVDCLIIYPTTQQNQNESYKLPSDLKKTPIDSFIRFYKMAVKLPVIEN
ncbi:MAG: hypothetical protein Fur0023_04850 [Bacteroidia bacterium]